MCPHEAVIQIRLSIVEKLGGPARAFTSAIPGVNTAARQGSAARWFAAYTDSRQGAEFSFGLAGHFKLAFENCPNVTHHTLNNKIVVLPHFFEGRPVLHAGSYALFHL